MDMQEQLRKIQEEAANQLENVRDKAGLDALRLKMLGKKGDLTQLLRSMGQLPAEERPKAGQMINVVRERLTEQMDALDSKIKRIEQEKMEAMQKANPVLLEPIMKVEVTMPEEYMDDVIGDINSRRGRIEGMDDLGGGKIVRGYVPLAEMFGYSTDLRSKTQGRGNYSMFFEKYEQVPKNIQEKIISEKGK